MPPNGLQRSTGSRLPGYLKAVEIFLPAQCRPIKESNLIVYPSRTTLDLPGLAYVLQGETPEVRNARLAELLGEGIIGAVRSLDAGLDAGTVVPSLAKTNLTPGLYDVMMLFDPAPRGPGFARVGSGDVAGRLGVSVSLASARLTELEKLGMIKQVERQGRTRIYERVEPAPFAPAPFIACTACGEPFFPEDFAGLCNDCYEDSADSE